MNATVHVRKPVCIYICVAQVSALRILKAKYNDGRYTPRRFQLIRRSATLYTA